MYTKDLPNFRKEAEHRRESPRYAEPVRKQGSRNPSDYENIRKESPCVRLDYGLDRNTSVDRRNLIQKIPNSPGEESKISDYYKNSPTVRPIPRPRTMENKNKDSSRQEDKTPPNTFENIWKNYADDKKIKGTSNFKPPAKSNN